MKLAPYLSFFEEMSTTTTTTTTTTRNQSAHRPAGFAAGNNAHIYMARNSFAKELMPLTQPRQSGPTL